MAMTMLDISSTPYPSHRVDIPAMKCFLKMYPGTFNVRRLDIRNGIWMSYWYGTSTMKVRLMWPSPSTLFSEEELWLSSQEHKSVVE